jgi:hypothetical protein
MLFSANLKDASRRETKFSIPLKNRNGRLIMLIERTGNNQIIITLPPSVDNFGLQRLIDYAKYLEATAGSKAKQADADKLADKVNATWWAKNSKRFIK